MPNTLVHIALQTMATRTAAGPTGCLTFALLGCVIPDVPWILQRTVEVTGPDPYLLRAYATAQATLFVSLLGAAVVSALARTPWRAFLVAGTGCVLHLLLDASEIKWANGVHFLAPFDWRQVNWGFAWPDHPAVGALTLAGIAVFAWYAWRCRGDGLDLRLDRRRMAIAGALAACYLAVPAAFLAEPFAADNHFLATLSDTGTRPGAYVELDRSAVSTDGRDWYVTTYAGESIRLRGFDAGPEGTYSLKGTFADPATLAVSDRHRHAGFRDAASVAGLSLVLAWLVYAALREYRRRDGGQESEP